MIIVTGIPRTGTSAVMRILAGLGLRIEPSYNEVVRGGHEAPAWVEFCHAVAWDNWFPTPQQARTWANAYGDEWRSKLDRLWAEHDALKCPRGWGAIAVAAEMGYPIDRLVICRRRLEEIVSKYGRLEYMVPKPFDAPLFGYAVYGYVTELTHVYRWPTVVVWYPDGLSRFAAQARGWMG